MAYSFPQSKKELQRLKHTPGWLLMSLFCLLVCFKIYMPYFSLRPTGRLCLIRLEGLQFKITYAAWCPISYMTLAMKQITVGLCASKLGTDVSILINPVPAFLAQTEFHHHLVLSAKNVWCADCSIFITGCIYSVRCETFKYFIFSCLIFFFFFSK